MPAVVMPQILLGGLFVPPEQMVDWLQTISDALPPLTYVIEALGEVGRTSLVTGKLLRETGIMTGPPSSIIALALAASALRRRTGALKRSTRQALLVILLVALIVGSALAASYVLQADESLRPGEVARWLGRRLRPVIRSASSAQSESPDRCLGA